MKRTLRKPCQLSQPLMDRLNGYTRAAAGVGVLLLTQSAAAKIVYTPTNEKIPYGFGNGLYLDVNKDGINDFFFFNFFSSTSSTLELSIQPLNKSNEVLSTGAGFAAALNAGAEIGPKGKFKQRLGDGMVNGYSFRKGTCVGPWAHANKKYLGLKFLVNGKTHYGWARLNVSCVFPHPINATLTGYAYQTVANKPIVAGKTKGPGAIAGEPGSLGSLARGAIGMEVGSPKK
jgi:hypothetical protein